MTALPALTLAFSLWLGSEQAPLPPKKPRALSKGDSIGLVAPASPLSPEQTRLAVEQIRKRGFTVVVADSGPRRGYLAGSDEARARALNELIRNPEIRAIFCLRGGYGSPRLLDRIDYTALANDPKAIIGYSDISALLLAVQAKSGMVSFHGPMGKEWASTRGLTPYSEKYFWDLLQGTAGERSNDWGGERPSGMRTPWTLVGGTGEGLLTGGNLSVVCATLGTPYEIKTQGTVLFLEEVGEKIFRIDRLLNQLRLTGKLGEVRGVILGVFAGCEEREPESALTLKEVLAEYLVPLGIPVLCDFPAGHVPDQPLLPLGVRVRVDATARKLLLLEPAVTPVASSPPPATE